RIKLNRAPSSPSLSPAWITEGPMRWPIFCAASAAAALGGAAQAASREVREAAVRVVVIPEARSDVSVEVASSHPRLPLQVRPGPERTIVDGGLHRRIRACRTVGGRTIVDVDVDGVGQVPYEQLPRIVV